MTVTLHQPSMRVRIQTAGYKKNKNMRGFREKCDLSKHTFIHIQEIIMMKIMKGIPSIKVNVIIQIINKAYNI